MSSGFKKTFFNVLGNGVTGCTRGDCISLRHEMCPDNKACYDSTCVDPCGPTFCGGGPCCSPSAQCRGTIKGL